jgi:uncharacterized protein with HEPN domain/predicted nucleotidyltransferase
VAMPINQEILSNIKSNLESFNEVKLDRPIIGKDLEELDKALRDNIHVKTIHWHENQKLYLDGPQVEQLYTSINERIKGNNKIARTSTNDKNSNSSSEEKNQISKMHPHSTSTQNSTEKYNLANINITPSLHDETLILKVWESYIQKKQLKYLVSEQLNEAATLFNGMSLQQEAAILIKADNTIYKRQNDGKSISFCSSVNCENLVSIDAGFNQISFNFNQALKQLKVWQEQNSNQALENHVILFPYRIRATPAHWALGVIELTFGNDRKLTSAIVAVYNPLPTCGGTKVNPIVKDELEQTIQTVFGYPTINLQSIEPFAAYRKQQNDGNACGPIIAENGKDFIDGVEAEVNSRLAREYPKDAVNLRLQHFNELDDDEFIERANEPIDYGIQRSVDEFSRSRAQSKQEHSKPKLVRPKLSNQCSENTKPVSDEQYLVNRLDNIYYAIEETLNHYQLFTETRITEPEFINLFKENLLKISWLVQSLPSSAKFRTKKEDNEKILISQAIPERNWLLLQELAKFVNKTTDKAILDNKEVIISDLDKFIVTIPDIQANILKQDNFVHFNLDDKGLAKNPLELTKLDSILCHDIDRELLSKMLTATRTILEDLVIDDEAINIFLADSKNHLAVFRAFEIIGECSKNISHTLRIKETIIPWQNISKSSERKNLLTDFRNELHHQREQIELVAKYETKYVKTLVKNVIPLIAERCEALLQQDERNEQTSQSDDSEKSKFAKAALEEIIHKVPERKKIFKHELSYFKSFLKPDAREFSLILEEIKDLPKTMNEFLRIAEQAIDESKFTGQEEKDNYDTALQDAYRCLTGKKMLHHRFKSYMEQIQSEVNKNRPFTVQELKNNIKTKLLAEGDSLTKAEIIHQLEQVYCSRELYTLFSHWLGVSILDDNKLKEQMAKYSELEILARAYNNEQEDDPLIVYDLYNNDFKKFLTNKAITDNKLRDALFTSFSKLLVIHNPTWFKNFITVCLDKLCSKSPEDLLNEILAKEDFSILKEFAEPIDNNHLKTILDKFNIILDTSELSELSEFVNKINYQGLTEEDKERLFEKIPIKEDSIDKKIATAKNILMETADIDHFNNDRKTKNIVKGIFSEDEVVRVLDSSEKEKILAEFIPLCRIRMLEAEKANKKKSLNEELKKFGKLAKEESILSGLLSAIYFPPYNASSKTKKPDKKGLASEIYIKMKGDSAPKAEYRENIVSKPKDSGDKSSQVYIDYIVAKIKALEFLIQEFMATHSPSAQKKLRLDIEFLLEEIGDRAEKLASFKRFNDTKQLAISKRYFNLLGVCRRLMAHPPLNLDDDLLNYIARILLLKTQVKLDPQVILNQGQIISSTYSKFREINLNELADKKLHITALLEGLGIKFNFKIYNANFRPALGLSADLNVLVEFDNGTDTDNSLLTEAEIRLSQILDADIKVYTAETLRQRQLGIITDEHIVRIKTEARTIEDILLQDKFSTMFAGKNWSTAFIPGLGRVNVSGFINAKEILSLVKFITNEENLPVEDLNKLITTPSLIQVKIEEKLHEYNEQLFDFQKLVDDYQNYYNVFTLLLNFAPTSISLEDWITYLKNLEHKIDILKQSQECFSVNYRQPLLEFLSIFFNQLIHPSILKYETVAIPTEASAHTDNPYTLYTGILKGGWQHPERCFPKSYPAILRKRVYQDEKGAYCYFDPMYGPWNIEILNRLPQDLNQFLSQPNNFRHLWQNISIDTRFLFYRGLTGYYLRDPNEVPESNVELINNAIITMDQLWHLNNIIYEQASEYNKQLYPAFSKYNSQHGWGIIHDTYPDGAVLIEHQHYLIKLSKYEMDMLYAKREDDSYSKADDYFSRIVPNQIMRGQYPLTQISGVASFLTRLFLLNKQLIIDSITKLGHINAETFAKASTAEHAPNQEFLSKRVTDAHQARSLRLDQRPLINKIIQSKADSYIDELLQKIANLSIYPNLLATFLKMIELQVHLHQEADNYYKLHEAELTRRYYIQDEKQRTMSEQISSHSRQLPMIKTKNDFRDICTDAIHQVLDFLINDKELLNRIKGISGKFNKLQNILEQNNLLSNNTIAIWGILNCLLHLIDDPSLVELLRTNPSKLEELKVKAYNNFKNKYLDATEPSQIILYIPNRQPLLMVDFSSEVEYTYYHESKIQSEQIFDGLATVQNQKLKGFLDRLKNNDINLVANVEEDLPSTCTYTYSVPIIFNGILGFNSELDRHLAAIHGQIAGHVRERKMNMPSLMVDSYVSTLSRYNQELLYSKFDYRGEIHSTSIFKQENITNLYDLMRLQGWTEEEIKSYGNDFTEDDQTICEYYEFRNLYDQLKSLSLRLNEYQEKIEECLELIEQHQTKKSSNFILKNLIDDYFTFFEAYKKLLERQKKISSDIMKLPYTCKRILLVIKEPYELEKLIEYINVTHLTDNNVEVVLQKIINTVRQEVCNELHRGIQINIVVAYEFLRKLEANQENISLLLKNMQVTSTKDISVYNSNNKVKTLFNLSWIDTTKAQLSIPKVEEVSTQAESKKNESQSNEQEKQENNPISSLYC